MSVNVEGTVSYLSEERVQGAVIRASHQGNGQQPVQTEVTNEAGDFTLALEPGQWQLIALHEKGSTNAQNILVENTPIKDVKFHLRKFDEHDQAQGWKFFRNTIIALLLLVTIYIALHLVFREPLDNILGPLITTVRSNVATAEPREAATEASTEEAEPNPAAEQPLDSVTRPTKELIARLIILAEDIRLTPEEQTAIEGYSSSLEEMLESDDLSNLDNQLIALEQRIASIAQHQSFFWRAEPGRFLEIIFGSLAGILVSKILSAGYYLYRRRFDGAGIYMHISHLVTVPVLAFITTILLSHATLQLTISDDNAIVADFSDPIWILVISFLISVNPWPLWGFAQRAGDRFLGQQNTSEPSS
jgi:hypothetical protein